MSVSDYNKEELIAFGNSIGDLVKAVTGDGVGPDDLDELMAAVRDGAKTINEFRDVPAAAGLHTLGAAANTYGDHLLDQAVQAEG